MAIPTFTLKQLFEAGVHYGHSKSRWNPQMAPYIYGTRDDIHIIDLEQTMPLLYKALEALRNIVSKGGRVLFVGTKMQASAKVQDAAQRSGQYYINHRWLGGLLTNWKTVTQSLKRLKDMEEKLNNPGGKTKKEILKLQRERDKLNRAIGGIREMGGIPDVIFIIDSNKESIAIQEAKRLRIPVISIVDSNSKLDGIDYIIPGNDDAMRAIQLYCDLAVGAILDGLQFEMRNSGIDIGASAVPSVEEVLNQQA